MLIRHVPGTCRARRTEATVLLQADGGFIPACAGSTPRRCCSPAGPWAHPRVRGEHQVEVVPDHLVGGSSPRARGAHGGIGTEQSPHGLIPACAGSTRSGSHRAVSQRAHPRVRGEHPSRMSRDTPGRGSSPRARGARRRRRPVRLRPGLIPACAGSTAWRVRSSSGWWAHPRVRGEDSTRAAGGASAAGSSPRARGAHFLTCMFSAHYPSFHSLSPNSRAAIHLLIHHISVVPREPPHRFPQPTPTTPEGRPRELQQPPQRAC